MKDFIKENKFICIMFILTMILCVYLIIPNKQIPGPMYGGDLYYSMGHSIHIYEMGGVFNSFHDSLSLETYPWLFHYLTGNISRILGIDIYYFNLYIIPIILSIILFLVWYKIYRILYSDKHLSLLLTLFSLLFFGIKNYYYATSFADLVVLPVILLCILYYFENKNMYGIFYVMVAIGVAGLTQLHLMYFACGLFVLLLFVKYKEKIDWLNLSLEGFAILIGAVISLLYFYIPVVYYGGNIINNWQQYSTVPLTLFSFIKLFLYDLTGKYIILKLISLSGVILFLITKFKTKHLALPLTLLLGVLGLIHPWITNPIIHTDFGYYKYYVLVSLGYLLFSTYSIYYTYTIITAKKEYFKYVFIIVMFLLLTYSTISVYKSDSYIRLGYSNTSTIMAQELYNDVKSVTKINDVFIAESVESSFALNGATGRKAVVIRRTHFNAFADFDLRSADMAVMLYGNDTVVRESLMVKYNVNYIYLDYYSELGKKVCLDEWSEFSNPLAMETSYNCLQTDVKYKDYLVENGIEVQKVQVRKDISRNDAEKFDMLIIKPKELPFDIVPLNDYNNQNYLIAKIVRE